MKSTTIARPLLAFLLAGLTASAAGAAPADKQAFLGQQAVFLSVEITQTGADEFGNVPKDSLTDGAHHYTGTAKFEIPFEMPLPGSCPPSSTSASPAGIDPEGRCTGWAPAAPDMSAIEEQLTTGKMDITKNPMFSPVEFTVDDVQQFRYRDTPATGFATNTTTSKGRGTAYVMRSGMVLCDLQKMTCDIANLSLGFHDGTDLVTVSGTSDVPGFEATQQKVGPSQLLPTVPNDVLRQLSGLGITLPLPFTKVLEARPTPSAKVTFKLTLSARPAPKAAAAAR